MFQTIFFLHSLTFVTAQLKMFKYLPNSAESICVCVFFLCTAALPQAPVTSIKLVFILLWAQCKHYLVHYPAPAEHPCRLLLWCVDVYLPLMLMTLNTFSTFFFFWQPVHYSEEPQFSHSLIDSSCTCALSYFIY